MSIDKINDDTFLSVTEAMGLAGEALEKGDTDLLLVISLAGECESAVLGGRVTIAQVERVEQLLVELKARALDEGEGDHVLHVWRG
ncbi:MAG: hypothetical protein NDI93_00580 [Pseudomonas sp.]|nr:hypothetical protein [Pseudomonas sp.]